MNKVNKWLIVLVVVLSLLVVLLGGYIVYDKTINDKDSDIQGTLLTIEEAKVILNNLEEKYYEYNRVKNFEAFCGEYDKDDYISFGSYETQDFRDYLASSQFKSIDELKEYFNNLMVDELKPNTIDNGVSYMEQDGKLYCQLSHKDLAGFRDYDKDTVYDISSIKEDIIVSYVAFWAYYMGDDDSIKREAKITIIKNDDGKWLVSDYEILEL